MSSDILQQATANFGEHLPLVIVYTFGALIAIWGRSEKPKLANIAIIGFGLLFSSLLAGSFRLALKNSINDVIINNVTFPKLLLLNLLGAVNFFGELAGWLLLLIVLSYAIKPITKIRGA